MNIRICLLSSALMLLPHADATAASTSSSYSDDTELFIYDFAKAGDFRPKVLFVFDNSGSMNTSTMMAKGDYDPLITYPKLASDDDGRNDYLYFSAGGTPPAILNSNNKKRFLSSNNACVSSLETLSEYGLITSVFWHYTIAKSGKSGSWTNIKSLSTVPKVVDCELDFKNKNPDNSSYKGTDFNVSSGYPVNNNVKADVKKAWSGATNVISPPPGAETESVTLYTANYLRWYHSSNTINISRLNIAKRALKELVLTTPAVDFGLAVYNDNSGNGANDKNGGRIIRAIAANDAIMSNGKTGSKDLLDKVTNLKGETYTPLCETLYEAYRYFGGMDLHYGDDDPDITPARDLSAENPTGKYLSPYDKCSSNGYIIYITDGEPTNDTAANTLVDNLIKSLPLASQQSYGGKVGYGTGKETSYLAALAGYMYNNDINPESAGVQKVTTFTIGFGDEAIKGAGNLLAETARRGGGKYYPATDSTQLNEALKSSLLAILRMNSSLVSPAIATNNFDRTRSLNNIYYAMFEPGTGPRWKGNLKKLVFSASKGYVADRDELPAISANGTILESAKTYWSSGTDGNNVAEGGVQEMLANKASRNLYVINKKLDAFNKTNLQTIAGTETLLRTHMGLSISDNLDGILNWIKGEDVYDEDTDPSTTLRSHIMGDPLHSRPLAINYGCTPEATCTPDLRIVVGTNSGFLHMFEDSGDTVDENWAVIPYPLLANQKALLDNLDSSSHIYGVDSSPVVLVNEKVRGGVIKSSDGDKVWIYTGLRSGGNAYYAMDISSPDMPKYMWTIDNTIAGFELLGQTWSLPEVAFIPGYNDSNGKAKPVLIFAGGYDVAKSALGQGTSDSMGQGIYIVDAESGALVFSASPAKATTINKEVAEMSYSMPGSVALLDGDVDGRTDRIYATDTGGNIWRMDLKGADKSKWSIFKFAAIGNSYLADADKTLVNDRRLFTQPVLVRTINKGWSYSNNQYAYNERPFDAVIIGTGDRNRPSSESTAKNVYVMLRDYNVKPTLFGVDPDASIPAPITLDDLYDVTADPFQDKTDAQLVDTQKALTSKLGWKFWLNELGEKTMGAGLVLDGKLYFTTFLPQAQSFQQCTIQSIGVMRQYMIDMHYGTSFKYVLDQNGNKTDYKERFVEVQNKVADDLVIHGGEDGRIRILGGAPGKEVILKNESGGGQPARCTDEGECAQGAEEAEVDMSPKKIYIYEGEQG